MAGNRSTKPGDERAAGLGDEQGTRVDSPDQAPKAPRLHSDSGSGRPERQTGAGSEASEGMHNSQQAGARDESDSTGLANTNTGRSDNRSGSEPIAEDGEQHRSGYGGAGGAPVNSSDTREPSKKS